MLKLGQLPPAMISLVPDCRRVLVRWLYFPPRDVVSAYEVCAALCRHSALAARQQVLTAQRAHGIGGPHAFVHGTSAMLITLVTLEYQDIGPPLSLELRKKGCDCRVDGSPIHESLSLWHCSYWKLLLSFSNNFGTRTTSCTGAPNRRATLASETLVPASSIKRRPHHIGVLISI